MTASVPSGGRMWRMPASGVSSEWVQDREDELARLISAKDEHLDQLRQLADLLRRRQFVTESYYRDLRDSLDYIAGALLVGKRNTATLRNHPPQ
jgi:hypothetical protein